MTKNRWVYILLIVVIIVTTVVTLINFINSKKSENTIIQNVPPVPNGYTLEKYTIASTSKQSCILNEECKTPMEFLLRSNCPYTSLCINSTCSVVCPNSNINK